VFAARALLNDEDEFGLLDGGSGGGDSARDLLDPLASASPGRAAECGPEGGCCFVWGRGVMSRGE